MKNVILTGFMGTGKSSVGKLLAMRLDYRYIDLDTLIVADAGISINEIFAGVGEKGFRDIESRILESLECEEGIVLSTGGGAVISEANRGLLHNLGLVVNLFASAEEIKRRLQHEQDRPLLNDNKSLERIETLIALREPYYADADIRVETTCKSVALIVEEILIRLKKVA